MAINDLDPTNYLNHKLPNQVSYHDHLSKSRYYNRCHQEYTFHLLELTCNNDRPNRIRLCHLHNLLHSKALRLPDYHPRNNPDDHCLADKYRYQKPDNPIRNFRKQFDNYHTVP